MMAIPDAYKKVPMMFRAQATGRCQVARIVDGHTDAMLWADEWTQEAETYPDRPETNTPGGVQTQDCTIAWRLLTNSGLDDSVILPVLGAKGIPFFPGSSMKGLFRRACTEAQADRYCGKVTDDRDCLPGILRFHGGYPIGDWTQDLVDVVHPQPQWQVQGQKEGGAFPVISLYKPTLRFGISSSECLSEAEWAEIWAIWQRALATGIGSRVSAGYGQIETSQPLVLFKAKLKGQGQAPKLLTGEAEFRPNMIRAAIRGHALRLFGGLTTAGKAQELVEDLFGGISQGGGTIGLLGLKFVESKLEMGEFPIGSPYVQPCYAVEGEVTWYLARKLEDSVEKEALEKLITVLMQFALVFGGFGKSWRRADHRLFFEEYYKNGGEALIGCHWFWQGTPSLSRHARKVRSPNHIRPFLAEVQRVALEWMRLRGVEPGGFAQGWREAWHPSRVQVWGRVAEGQEDSEATYWFHGPYRKAQPNICREGTIYQTDFPGKVQHGGKVGRLWHRMYPLVTLRPDPKKPERKLVNLSRNPRFLELLTIFTDDSAVCADFLGFLETNPAGFERLWGE